MNSKKKIMLHIIMANQVSGPNTQNKLISNSLLSKKYDFYFLHQNFHSGNKISLKLIQNMIDQIKLIDPDIIHLSGLQSSAFHAVIAAKICRKPVLLAIRGSSRDSLSIGFLKKFFLSHFIEPLTLRLVDKFYSVCDAMGRRKFLKKYYGKYLGTIYNAKPEIELKDKELVNLKLFYNIPKNSILVAIVGRMVYDKGIVYIVEAIQKIKESNLVFVFIGDGPLIEYIKNELKDSILINRIIIIGKIDNVLGILSNCDIFLFATLHENLSNSLLEACSLGLAVIATNVGGNPEVIINNYSGILIPPSNSQSITDALCDLEFNPQKRIKLGENAKRTVTKNFSQKKLFSKIDEIYQEILHIS